MSLRVTGIRGAFDRGNERLRVASLAAATEMAQEGERFIKEHMLDEGKKDTGLTAQAVKAEPAREVGYGVARANVEVASQQMTPAVVLEHGRAKGKPVSAAGRSKIATWVRRKVPQFVAEIRAVAEARAAVAGRKPKGRKADREQAAAESAAFLIARAISRRGLPAFHFFSRARHHVQGKAMDIYRRVLARLPRTAGGAR